MGVTPPTMAEARAALDDAVVALRDLAAGPERYSRAPMLQHTIDAALDTLVAAAQQEEREAIVQRIREERREAYAEGVRATHRMYAIRRGDAA